MGVFSTLAATATAAAGDKFSSLLGSWYQNKQNKKAQERDQRFQEYMWNKQNEYNLPINQMARLREAGLNPQLALGDVNSVASASLGGQSPTGHSASMPDTGIDILSALESYRQAQLLSEKAKTEKVAQKQMRAQTMNTKEQTKFLGFQMKNIDADTRLKLLNYALEDIKRQSGIVGNDTISNLGRSVYGTSFGLMKHLGEGIGAGGAWLVNKFKNKKKEK